MWYDYVWYMFYICLISCLTFLRSAYLLVSECFRFNSQQPALRTAAGPHGLRLPGQVWFPSAVPRSSGLFVLPTANKYAYFMWGWGCSNVNSWCFWSKWQVMKTVHSLETMGKTMPILAILGAKCEVSSKNVPLTQIQVAVLLWRRGSSDLWWLLPLASVDVKNPRPKLFGTHRSLQESSSFPWLSPQSFSSKLRLKTIKWKKLNSGPRKLEPSDAGPGMVCVGSESLNQHGSAMIPVGSMALQVPTLQVQVTLSRGKGGAEAMEAVGSGLTALPHPIESLKIKP